MASCPECRTPVSAANVLCPMCGYVLRPDAFQKAKSTARRRATLQKGGIPRPVRWLLYGVGGIAVLVVALMGLAFVALPHLIPAGVRESEEDGVALLRKLLAAERRYHEQNGTFTDDPYALRSIGWEAPNGRRYTVRVSRAESQLLCLEADPVPRERDLAPGGPLSMNGEGFLFHQNGCAGDPDIRRSLPSIDQ